MKRLHSMGVKKVSVTSMEPIGCLPGETANSSFRQCNDNLNAIVMLHNSKLQEMVARLNSQTPDSPYFILDLFNPFITIFKQKKLPQEGSTRFETPLKPCCVGVSKGYDCANVDQKGVKMYKICSDPNVAFFWDISHPTQAGCERIAMQSKIHSYGRSFNALAAWLLPHEAKTLSGMPTTVKRNLPVESDIIVGLIDSGIYIDSPSFNDKGIGPPPAKWKGKVIGAQAFNLLDTNNQTSSPADFEGHGTHTASTVAGSLHQGASLYGLLNGTARGGVPAARIAMYKACNDGECADVDILAAFDAAIADGVDILSVSLGGSPSNYNEDPVAIGSFHAMQKGILTSCSAGNEGERGVGPTVTNVAPWIFTWAAASTDRQLETMLNWVMDENSPSSFPLTSGTLASLSLRGFGRNCEEGTLDESKVKGKILYCVSQNRQDSTIEKMGAKGIIISDQVSLQNAFPFRIPASLVEFLEIAKPLGVKDADLELAYGAGMIDPTAATNPSLVFDIDEAAYISFLCKIGYNSSNLLQQITGNTTKDCSRILYPNGEDGLNYPTINLNFNTISNTNPKIVGVFHRTVTNVGEASAVYKATVEAPKGLSIEVSPNVLSFNNKNEKNLFRFL
nr:subtilisin-like protease SBT4.15 [Ipomoea batatas]